MSDRHVHGWGVPVKDVDSTPEGLWPYARFMFQVRAEHKARIVRLAVCAELYRRHNETEKAKEHLLDAEILRLTHKFTQRFGPLVRYEKKQEAA
jgi:hypothetical protein